MFNKKNKLKKYRVSARSWIILLLIALLALSFYAFIVSSIDLDAKKNSIFVALKDLSVVVMSILGTNLLLSVFVEVNNRNKAINNFFNEDIISSPEFYNNLNADSRQKMLVGLELAEHCDDKKALHDMYKSIQRKMKSFINDEYYLESCDYVVHCTDEGEFYRKEILKTMVIKSYKENLTINNYKIVDVSFGKMDNGLKLFELGKVYINGVEINEYDINGTQNQALTETRNGYTEKMEVYLKDPLNINDIEGVEIVVNSITRCPKEDKIATFRSAKPCKNFTVHYIVNSDKYKVTGNAFGFLDCAPSFPNVINKNEVKLGFRDWIFTDDGIVVTMIEDISSI